MRGATTNTASPANQWSISYHTDVMPALRKGWSRQAQVFQGSTWQPQGRIRQRGERHCSVFHATCFTYYLISVIIPVSLFWFGLLLILSLCYFFNLFLSQPMRFLPFSLNLPSHPNRGQGTSWISVCQKEINPRTSLYTSQADCLASIAICKNLRNISDRTHAHH